MIKISMWFIFSLLAAFFFALVHIMDSYCVEEIFEKPWMGVITSSIASLIILPLLPTISPLINWTLPQGHIVFLAFSCGILIQISQLFYFNALEYSDAGIVSSYWNFVPMFLPISMFLLYGKVLSLPQYFGILILIFTSVTMCLMEGGIEAKWKSFFLMIFASILQVAAYLIENIVFKESNFFLGFLIITSGIIITGLTPLFFKKIRRILKKNIKKIITLLRFFVLIEIVNLAALLFAQLGIANGNPALVAAVETTIPAHVFLLSFIILFFFPKLKHNNVLININIKIILVIFMCFGVWLVY